MKIVWTDESLAELAAIQAHIGQDSPQAAKAMVLRLIERCEQLARSPRSAPRLSRYRRETVRMLYERPYRIVYEIKDPCIQIVTLWHYRQRAPRHLR